MRSVLAVAAGFVIIFVLAIGTDLLVRFALPGAFDALGRTESAPVLLFTLGYLFVFGTAGCYLAARWAPHSPVRHALALGLAGLLFSTVGTVVLWASAPPWYHVAALTLVMPAAWLGGRIREREARTTLTA